MPLGEVSHGVGVGPRGQRLLLRSAGYQKRGAALTVVAGEIDRLREGVPQELQPLARELNQFIVAWRNHLERSRQALGNLAHRTGSAVSTGR